MRITDFPLLMNVKDEYLQTRNSGNSREQATSEILRRYSDEITLGSEDDGPLVWIGLADGQYANRELTTDISEKAVAALDFLEQGPWHITQGDIRHRKENYSRAPMPEKRIGKPCPKFHCTWAVGDTFAYWLNGFTGTEAPWLLLQKVSETEWSDGSLFPVVYLSLWEKEELPHTEEDYRSAPLLKVNRGRFCLPQTYHEYRTAILIKNKKQLAALSLAYIGSFRPVEQPEDEVIIENAAMMTLTPLEFFARNMQIYIKRSCHFNSEISSTNH